MISKLAYKLITTAIICFMCSVNSLAHKANEAFYTFQELDSTISVHAEFPWSIRMVLLDYDKTLNESSNESAFLKSLESYFHENLIIKDIDGLILEMISFRFLPQHGHSHQSDFELIYNGSKLRSVENNLFISFFENQKNYHQDINTGKRYTTGSVKASFYIGENQDLSRIASGFIYKTVLIILASGFCLLITKYKKAKAPGIHQTDIIHNTL